MSMCKGPGVRYSPETMAATFAVMHFRLRIDYARHISEVFGISHSNHSSCQRS